jgi:hypothetical protein
MNMNEIVKSFLKQPAPPESGESSAVPNDNVINDLSNDDIYTSPGVFFDDGNGYSAFGQSKQSEYAGRQAAKIDSYRQLSMNPDVTNAIDEIVNEIIFSFDDEIPIKIDINEDNDKLVEAITGKFKKVLKLTDVKRSLYHIVKSGYVDGQLIAHCSYDTKNLKNGIKAVKLIDPRMFYFDPKSSTFKYMKKEQYSMSPSKNIDEYNVEEIVQEDFSLYDDGLRLSYLEYALKSANMLKTLEDLLIPLRFSRSISRRVFNVDIGDLPSKRGAEVMKDHQNKFKYKKFYNNETGEVTNQQHITSMVEDYWFSNRSGGKGTTVDVLDESGNLGELDDILYMVKKVYSCLKIPSNRISSNPDADGEFDYDSSRVSKEDMKFFMYISRLRKVYTSFYKEILKREVICCGIMTETEWEEKEEYIEISFAQENKFIEKMKLSALQEKINIYADVKEYAGSLFSHNEAMKMIFRYSDEDIQNNLKEISKEEKDPVFAKFYATDEDM